MTTESSCKMPSSYAPEEMKCFLETFFYAPEAFLVDEVLLVDAERREVKARTDTTRPWLVTPFQRGDPATHPRHVAGADLMTLTTNLGALHAYFIHGCRWSEGWVGFGGRIHQAEFKRLVELGPALELHSVETRTRKSETRLVTRYTFRFFQAGRLVYYSDQTAQFMRQV